MVTCALLYWNALQRISISLLQTLDMAIATLYLKLPRSLSRTGRGLEGSRGLQMLSQLLHEALLLRWVPAVIRTLQ